MKSKASTLALLLAPSVLVLLMLTFAWTLIGWVTPFLYPSILFGGWVVLGAASLVTVVLLFRKERYWRWQNYLPLIAAIAVVLLALFCPFTEFELKLNFLAFRHAREAFAADVFAGKNPEHPSKNCYLHMHGFFSGLISEDDGTVDYDKYANGAAVYFYTYRGILGQSTGYYYTSSDFRPVETDYFHVTRKVAPRWYLVETE